MCFQMYILLLYNRHVLIHSCILLRILIDCFFLIPVLLGCIFILCSVISVIACCQSETMRSGR